MFNLKFAVKHFFHQIKAINRHGLHSPFVYRLVDKVIYDLGPKKVYGDIENRLPGNQKLNKSDKLICRLITDGNINTACTGGNVDDKYSAILQAAVPVIDAEDDKPVDLILLQASNSRQVLEDYNSCAHKAHPNTMLIIADIYNSPAAWEVIKASTNITVTVDLFFTGIAFYRTGQVKEDFRIKF